MICVLFEVLLSKNGKQGYMAAVQELKDHLEKVDGFLSVERFQSLAVPDKLISVSYWSDMKAVDCWREQEQHRAAQKLGIEVLFQRYRIQVLSVIREKVQAPLKPE